MGEEYCRPDVPRPVRSLRAVNNGVRYLKYAREADYPIRESTLAGHVFFGGLLGWTLDKNQVKDVTDAAEWMWSHDEIFDPFVRILTKEKSGNAKYWSAVDKAWTEFDMNGYNQDSSSIDILKEWGEKSNVLEWRHNRPFGTSDDQIPTKYKAVNEKIMDDESDMNKVLNGYRESMRDVLRYRGLTADYFVKGWLNAACLPYENSELRRIRGGVGLLQIIDDLGTAGEDFDWGIAGLVEATYAGLELDEDSRTGRMIDGTRVGSEIYTNVLEATSFALDDFYGCRDRPYSLDKIARPALSVGGWVKSYASCPKELRLGWTPSAKTGYLSSYLGIAITG